MNHSEKNTQSDRTTASPESQKGAGKEGKWLSPPSYGIQMADFPGIKVHSNSQKAKEIGARAFTRGNDIHFSPGEFQPSTQKGQKLIQHELTHVAQQREKRITPTDTKKGLKVNNDPKLEGEANQVAKSGSIIQRFSSVSNMSSLSSNVLQAEWEGDEYEEKNWDERKSGLRWYKSLYGDEFLFDIENWTEAVEFFSIEEETVEETKLFIKNKIEIYENLYRSRTDWLDISYDIGKELYPPDTTEEQITEFLKSFEEVERESWEDELDALLDQPLDLYEEEEEQSIDEDHGVLRYEDPTITSVRNPQYTSRGAYAWTVEMETNEARAKKTFIIQEISIEESTQKGTEEHHFWEAFKVPENKTKAKHRDVYQSNLRSENCQVIVNGKMQLLSLNKDEDVPKPLVKGGAEYSDSTQLSSNSAPQGWVEGEGTVHNLYFTLKNGVLQEHGTVPVTGDWEEKNNHWELDSG